jgi:IMP dehydrogenase
MALAVIASNGLAILHRFMEPKEQIETAQAIQQACGKRFFTCQFVASVGVKLSDREMVEQFYQVGIKNICIDIAHGDSLGCVEMIKWIKKKYPEMYIIAGNVSTGSGAERLWRAGANTIKVGIGPGSLCSTRIETGNGVPQLSALIDVSNKRSQIKASFNIISDGGCKSAGDLVKSLCFADMVMTGNLFAGCVETPAKQITVNGTTYKEYVGSSTHKPNHIEGVAALVPPKGTYQSVLDKLLEGIRSGCSYQGAYNLEELKKNPIFVRITNAGLAESHPHSVIIK